MVQPLAELSGTQRRGVMEALGDVASVPRQFVGGVGVLSNPVKNRA